MAVQGKVTEPMDQVSSVMEPTTLLPTLGSTAPSVTSDFRVNDWLSQQKKPSEGTAEPVSAEQ